MPKQKRRGARLACRAESDLMRQLGSPVSARLPRHSRTRGFSLIELMIVVVIIGALAAVALVGFRKYLARARTAEVVSVLAEMNSKEQVYFLEFGAYLPLRADNVITMPSGNESASAFYPVSPSATNFYSTYTSTSIANPALWPTAWRSVGLRVRERELYCTYMTNAGNAGDAMPGANTVGTVALGAMGAGQPAWFYSIGACNLAGAAGWPTNVAYFVLSSATPAMRAFNENR